MQSTVEKCAYGRARVPPALGRALHARIDRRAFGSRSRPYRLSLAAAVDEGALRTEETVSDALILAWYAAGNKSLLAAKCFVETVLQCYQKGCTVDELEMSMQLKNLQTSPRLLAPLDQDILLSWMLLIMLTADQLGVEWASSSSSPGQTDQSSTSTSSTSSAGSSTEAATTITTKFTNEMAGLLGYVKQTLKQYTELEYTLSRIQFLQAAASQESQGRSQFLELMQQYTRLIMITIEVVAALKLPTRIPLTNPCTIQAPSGYTAAFWPELLSSSTSGTSTSESTGQEAAQEGAAASGAEALQVAVATPVTPVRAAAVQLLIAFIGAALGAPYAQQCFIRFAAEAYDAGFAAEDLYQQLQEEEYLQSGGLLPVPGPAAMQVINAELFGRWLSLCYMTMAQLGVVFPAAAERSGWAWAGAGDEVEANALAAFALQTIRKLENEKLQAQQEAEATGDALDAAPAVLDDPLAAKIRSIPEAAKELEAVTEAAAKELLERGTLKGKELPPMVKIADEELAATSSGLRVWGQMIGLAEATYRLVVEQQQQQDLSQQSSQQGM